MSLCYTVFCFNTDSDEVMITCETLMKCLYIHVVGKRGNTWPYNVRKPW